jgi:glycosyltransferase involved in cell wall biosynthesis
MACEKAVLVSDIPEFSFVTEHGAGIAFRSGDPVSLAQSMKDMAFSDMREEMGKRAREFVEDRTWDSIAMVYEQFLQHVIESNRDT